jgi:hypothetical protein
MMMLGPAVVGRALHGLEQRQLALLKRHVLGVLERQVEEAAQVILDRLILPPVQRHDREMPRQRVGGEGMARVAEHIPRKLVQQDQQGQRALRSLRPVIQLAPGRHEVRRLEPLPEQGVEGVVLCEPLRRARFFPEADDVRWRYLCVHDRSDSHAAARIP